MLKNIYFQFGDFATNFLIMQYCRENKQYLAENNLHYVELQDFIHVPFDWYNCIHCNIFRGENYFQKNFPGISYQDIIIQLKKYIEEKKIENLIIPFAINNFDVCLPYLIIFCKNFSEAAFHCEMNTTGFFRNLSVNYNLPFIFISKNTFYTCLPELYLRFSVNTIRVNRGILSNIERVFKLTPQVNVFSNEIEGFENWLTGHNLSKQREVFSAVFSPQVLAFATALKEYYFQDSYVDFYNEQDFLYAYASPTQIYSYASAKMKKDFIEKYPDEIPLPISAPYEEIDCSEASLRITLDDALYLAAKLSSSTRQKLLQGFNTEDIKYMPVSSVTVYLALMHAEGRIGLEEVHAYLRAPLGRISIPETDYKENPILTVFTTSYNSKKYIKQCIDSILAQKIKYPFIHLICDDGSTDGSQELIQEYAQKYPHIRAVLRKQNSIQINYHAMYNNIPTKYVAVCDGDDFYTDPHKLEKQVELLEQNEKYGLCFHPTYVYYEKENMIKYIHPLGMPEFTVKDTYYPSNIILTNLMQSSSVMFRWKLRNGIFHSFPSNCPPYDWAFNIIHSMQSLIGYINEPMSLYRRHDKAIYYGTEVSVAKHVIENSIRELFFCKVLDIYTEKKYHSLFLKKVFSVLSTFYYADEISQVDQYNYRLLKESIETFFPEYILSFKEYIDKLAKKS